jgi:DNA-binding NarL/FixJ family response regulator
MDAITIAIVDCYPVVVDGLTAAFDKCAPFQVVATGRTIADALSIAVQSKPDILLIEPMIAGDVLAAIAAIGAKCPDTKIIALTVGGSVEAAVRILELGVKGYVLKTSSSGQIIDAVRAVLSGENYITQSFASKMISALRAVSMNRGSPQPDRLSIREEQIVRYLNQGKTNREIAMELALSEKTVKHYMTNLMQKLQVRNRTEVVISAQRLVSAQSGISLTH